ncbi:hypothetical protein D3C87_1436150 [compost metagenome]
MVGPALAPFHHLAGFGQKCIEPVLGTGDARFGGHQFFGVHFALGFAPRQGIAHLRNCGAGLGAAPVRFFKPLDQAAGLFFEEGGPLALNGQCRGQLVDVTLVIARQCHAIDAGRLGEAPAQGIAQGLDLAGTGFELPVALAQPVRQIGAVLFEFENAGP